MGSLWQDIRYGFRVLIKSPGLTLVVIFSLALGIGANSAIFSLVNTILFRPLPVKNPDELVTLYTGGNMGRLYGSSSYADYKDFRDKTDVFSGLIAFSELPLSLTEAGRAERINAMIVTGNYFTMLGVEAARGRTFTAGEDQKPGEFPLVVISHGLWQRRFGSDPSLVGKTLLLNNHSFTVVGIAPERFTGTDLTLPPDVWIPVMMYAELGLPDDVINKRSNRWFSIMGRLKEGVSLEQARARLNVLAGQLRQEYTEWSTNKNAGLSITILPQHTLKFNPETQGTFLGLAGFLLVVTGLVLLIACANIANLLLARAATRKREIAVRMALGADRSRLIRQLLTESVLLSLIGGAVGLLVADWTNGLLAAYKPPIPIPALDLSMDVRVLLFTLLLSLLTGIVFGLSPALYATKMDLVPALKDEAVMPSRGDRRFGLRNILMVLQVAISLVLLIGAGLFIRSFQKAQSISPGFDADKVLTMSPDLDIQGYDKNKSKSFYEEVGRRVETLPGVEAASWAQDIPLGMLSGMAPITIEGYEPHPGELMISSFNIVDKHYFKTMGINLTSGRDFGPEDREDSPTVAIINETMAKHFWPNQSALGHRIQAGEGNAPLQIVGVVKDIKYSTLGEPPTSYFYKPLAQNENPVMKLHVRAQGDPKNMISAVRKEIQSVDSSLPVSNIRPMSDVLGVALLLPRLGATLLGLFGLLATVLATTGIFGVMSFSVARRTREIGIRMALGAQARDVLRLVLGEALVVILAGIALGFALAFVFTRLLSRLLYGVSATDPMTFLGVSLLLTLVALIASYIPARKATKVDPMIALRYE
jgi:macrolide transport system ATP-binding/permease protein